MTLFEFLFFKCRKYQIANYANKYYGKSEKEIFEMIIDTVFFVTDDNGWIQSVDRSNKLCTKYAPTICELNIMSTKFTTKNAKQMLKDTNLILQYIDHRTWSIDMNLNIKYEDEDEDQKWQNKAFHFVFKVGNNFKWKIDCNVTFTRNKIFMSSLWITNNSKISRVSKHDGDDDDEHKYDDNDIDINNVISSNMGEFKIICEQTIIIDEKCSISMNECGVKG
eukprot:96081_1